MIYNVGKQFRCRRHSSTLSSLDTRYAVEVRDMTVKSASERSYRLLKSEFIKRMGSSQEQNTYRLLENEPLDERKPSQFLHPWTRRDNVSRRSVTDFVVRSPTETNTGPTRRTLALERKLPIW